MQKPKLTLSKIADDYYQIKDVEGWCIIQLSNFDDGWTIELSECHCIHKFPKSVSFAEALKKGISVMRKQLNRRKQRIKDLLIELVLPIELEEDNG